MAGGQVQAFGQAAGGLCRSPEKRFSEVRDTTEGLEAGLLEGRRSGDQDAHRPVGVGSYCRRHGLWGGEETTLWRTSQVLTFTGRHSKG